MYVLRISTTMTNCLVSGKFNEQSQCFCFVSTFIWWQPPKQNEQPTRTMNKISIFFCWCPKKNKTEYYCFFCLAVCRCEYDYPRHLRLSPFGECFICCLYGNIVQVNECSSILLYTIDEHWKKRLRINSWKSSTNNRKNVHSPLLLTSKRKRISIQLSDIVDI